MPKMVAGKLGTRSQQMLKKDSPNNVNNKKHNTDLECGERTPLLGSKPSRLGTGIALFGLGFLLIGGVGVGSYLLIKQYRGPPFGFSFDLVHREVWSSANDIPMGNLLDSDKVLRVIVFHTRTKNCFETWGCVHLLQFMQKQFSQKTNSEIPYNFMIGGDGLTYEIRGWKYESGFDFIPKSSSLTIGFVGNFTQSKPSEFQLDQALALIEDSLKRRKLHPNYQIYGVRNLTVSHNDADGLFQGISTWPNFDTILEIL